MSREMSWERRWGFDIPGIGDFYVMELISGDAWPWRSVFMHESGDHGLKVDCDTKIDAMAWALRQAIIAVEASRK